MGRSATAYIFYGIDFDESSDDHITLSSEPEEQYAVNCGFPKPSVPYDSFANQEIHRAFWTKKQELMEASDCTIETYGYGDEPYYFIAIKSSVITAWQGDSIPVNLPEIPSDWNQKLKDFCDKLGVQYSPPSWKLVSYYG